MRLVETLVAGGDADVLDAHLAFQLNAGVDLVLAAADGSSEPVTHVLESYARAGCVLTRRAETTPAELILLAAAEHEANWVISTTPEEFWWPRAASLKDVLAPVPPRYTIVQALVRELVAGAGSEGAAVERAVVRRVSSARPSAPGGGLRGVRRIRPGAPVDLSSDGQVPLRAWYPIEVLRLPMSGETADAGMLERGLADGSLVPDERLRDVLRRLAASAGTDAPARTYALPSETADGVGFGPPGVVDDAAYAVDCAAVGEVDLGILDAQIRALEDRIVELEQRVWPRVVRRVSRFAGRRRT